MITLGIESSCDETSCAVLRDGDELLSNIISSSLFRHKPFGGVVPEIASRHCLEQIDTVFSEALKEAQVKQNELDLIAVTYGPGLIGSLFVGISFAKALSYQLGIPLVGVNHLEAHLVANFIGKQQPERYLGLLVSGGHTSLSSHDHGRMKLLGSTVDDAVGEAYDKVSKLLGLGYPGGPIVEKKALQGRAGIFKFTKPKLAEKFDFSFSGIKTAVLHEVQKQKYGLVQNRKVDVKDSQDLSEDFICDLARGFQDAVVEWLIEKTIAAALDIKVESIVVGGGVSANSFLRAELSQAAKEKGMSVFFPERLLSLDNAGMIARRGFEMYQAGERATLRLTGVPSLKLASIH